MKRSGVVSWPVEVATSYRRAGYWRGQPLGSLVQEWASRYGGRTALVDGETRFTYTELAESADTLADSLAARGLQDGDNMLVQLPNGWELVVLLLACLRLGVAPVMMLPSHREYEMVNIARHVDAVAVAVADQIRGYDHQALAHRVAGAVPTVRHVLVAGDEIRPDSTSLRELVAPRPGAAERRRDLTARAPAASDVALFLLSGGTTGLPKLISRTHDDYEYNARRAAEVCGFGPDTVYLVALPAGHNFPLGCPGILGTLMVGGRVVLLPSPAPAPVFAAVREEGVTDVAAVPAVLRRWTEAAEEAGAELPSLRMVQVGGSVIGAEVVDRARRALDCRVQQVFGMAEGLLNFTRAGDPDEVLLTTQGRPMSDGDEILIVDENDEPVAPGGTGELLTRGPYTLRGYFRSPDHNAVSFTPDGWYRTGDLVRVHPSGNLVVAGRRKDMINRGGEKISADEVEGIVRRLPQVVDAAAVPVPDETLGERVCLFVVLRAGRTLTLTGLREFFTRTGVARFKTPERLEVLDAMPLTAVGKLDKKALTALAVAQTPPRAAVTAGRAHRSADPSAPRRAAFHLLEKDMPDQLLVSEPGPSRGPVPATTWEVRAHRPVSYQVNVVRGVLDPGNPALLETGGTDPGSHAGSRRRFIVVDRTVDELYGAALRGYLDHHKVDHHLCVLETSEESKNMDSVFRIVRELDKFGIDRRREPIIGIGGGVLLDIVGLASSLYRRHTPYVRVPTTLIGLVDAGVGAKTGVNFGPHKNRLGSYEPPTAALLDRTFLKTLDRRHISNGLAEILKIGLIKDGELFALLEKFGEVLIDEHLQGASAVSEAATRNVLWRAVHGMLEELQPNLWESKLERLVDYGHSVSPTIEMRALPALLHGEAVAIDMAFTTVLAARRGLVSRTDRDRILAVTRRLELPVWHPLCEPDVLTRALEDTTRHRDGLQRLPLPVGIGGARFVNDITADELAAAAEELGTLAQRTEFEVMA